MGKKTNPQKRSRRNHRPPPTVYRPLLADQCRTLTTRPHHSNRLISTVAKVAKVNSRTDDDLSDRLHHRYTILFLVSFAVVVSTGQYVGNPIHCWCPAYFTGNHQEYTNRVCWVKNSYSLPGDAVPGVPGAVKRRISYYQWVPVALLVQAVLYYMPCVVWRVCADRSGINIGNLVEAAETIQNALYPERRDKTIKYMIRHFDHYLTYQKEYRGGCCALVKHVLARYTCLSCGNRYGNYLVGLYLFTKLLYFGNVALQLFLMNIFLGDSYHTYGLTVLEDLARPSLPGGVRVGRAELRFPRTTLCDFRVRQMGTTHPHTVQCVLPINLFNEKIYAFLWFWMIFISAATVVSFARWTWTLMFRYSRLRYIRKHLVVMKVLDETDDNQMRLSNRFTEFYLRQDGVFVLKLVAKNSTDLVVADIVSALWENYRRKPADGVRPGDEYDDGSL